jgi:hypothetical protein
VSENSNSLLKLLPPARGGLAEMAGVVFEALQNSLDATRPEGHRDPPAEIALLMERKGKEILGWPSRLRRDFELLANFCREHSADSPDASKQAITAAEYFAAEFKDHLEGALEMLVRYRDQVLAPLARQGHPVSFTAELDREIAELQGFAQEAAQKWPLFCFRARHEQQAREGGLEYLDPDEAFAEAVGVGVEEWRGRVSRYKSATGR